MDEPFSVDPQEPFNAGEQMPVQAGCQTFAEPAEILPTTDPPSPVQPTTADWPVLSARPYLSAGAVCVDGVIWLPAGFWPRTGAFLLDMLILLVISQMVVAVTGVRVPDFQQLLDVLTKAFGLALSGTGLSSQTSIALDQAEKAMQFSGEVNLAVCAAYFTVMHGIAGTTLGKLALGLRVMRRNGKQLGLGWAFLRYLGYFLLAKFVYSAWMIPLDTERRTLYDIALTTNVFRRRTA